MPTAPRPTVDESLIDDVVKRLTTNTTVRRNLPDGGRLHIDRQVPFIVVYRPPSSAPSPDLSRFVQGEASYLIAPAGRRHRRGVDSLVTAVSETLVGVFGGFAIVELFAAPEPPPDSEPPNKAAIRFTVAIPKEAVGSPSVRALEAALSRVTIDRASASVDYDVGRRAPPGLGRLAERVVDAEAPEWSGVNWIGIGIPPAHVDRETGVEYPAIARSMHRQVSRAIQRTVFEFAHHQTTQRPLHYQALGRRAFVRAVKRVDEELAAVASSFDLLLGVSPTNADSEYRRFRRTGRPPRFQYRPLTVDPSLLKRNLYGVAVERVEDPTLERLFREKQRELSLKLDLLTDRGTKRFLPTSLALYGSVDESTRTAANELLAKLPRERDSRPRRRVGADELARLVAEEIERYRTILPEVGATVSVRDDVSTMMVSSGHVIIGSSVRVASDRVEALIQHEVGTHVVTYWNGTVQPFRLLATGLEGHDELQEGLAVLAEHLVGGLTPGRMRTLAARVVAVDSVVDGASFRDTHELLTEEHGMLERTAFQVSTRVHRGGGFAKDAAYLRGLRRVVEYLGAGGRIDTLLVGKMAISHTAVIEELQRRGVLVTPPLRPTYLDDPDTHYRLEALRKDPNLLGLADGPQPA